MIADRFWLGNLSEIMFYLLKEEQSTRDELFIQYKKEVSIP